MTNREQILKGSMKELFLHFGLPAIIGMLVLQVYNLTDAIFVGRLISKEAVGAIGIAYIIVLLNQVFFILIGNGAGALVSIATGKKDNDRCNRLMADTLLYSALPSLLVAVLVYVFAGRIIPLFGATGEISELTLRYLRTLVYGMPVVSVLGSMHSILRAEGFVKESTFYMMISVLLNIILDFVFISILDLHIEGAALATVIAQVAGLAISASHYLSGKSVISVSKLRIDHSLILPVIRNGSGQAFMHLSGILFMSFLYNALSRYGGDNEIIILTASLRVWEYFFFVLLGASFGMQTVAGISYGAGDYARVKRIFRFYLILGLIVSVGTWICFMGFPGTFISWFVNDRSLVANGITPFRLLNSIFFLLGASTMISMLFVSVGKGELSFLSVLLQQVVFFIPLVMALPRLFGVSGIWLTVPASGLLSFLVQLVLFSGVWKGFTAVKERRSSAVAQSV